MGTPISLGQSPYKDNDYIHPIGKFIDNQEQGLAPPLCTEMTHIFLKYK